MQLLLVVECSKESKSDEMYIKSFIDNYFIIGGNKLSFVYLNGKTNYKNIKNKINKKIKDYSDDCNDSHVIFCLDTDINTPNNEVLNNDIVSFATTNGYELVWFCKDIEDVFLNKKIVKNLKTKTAIDFYRKNSSNNLNIDNFSINKNWDKLNSKNSNLYTVINKYLSKKEGK